MIAAKSLSDALKIVGVVAIFLNSDGSATAYVKGDVLPAKAAPIPTKIIQIDDFIGRFLDSELTALLTLANSGDNTAQLILMKLQTMTTIDLLAAKTISGINYLVTKSVITAARETVIMA